MKYNGGLTREQFMFNEMRITARLLSEGLSDQEVLERVYNENLFQYPTEKEIKSKCKACLKRLAYLKEIPELMEALTSGTISEAKQAALIAMMLQSRLLAEFMITVIGEKYRSLDMTMTKKDMNVFFSNLAQQDEGVAGWSEKTVNKIKVVLKYLILCQHLLQLQRQILFLDLALDPVLKCRLLRPPGKNTVLQQLLSDSACSLRK